MLNLIIFQVLDYDECYGNPDEAYYEDDFIVDESMANIALPTTGEERLVSEDGLEDGIER